MGTHSYRSRYSQYVRKVKGQLIRHHNWSPRVTNEWAKNNHEFMRIVFQNNADPIDVAKDIVEINNA